MAGRPLLVVFLGGLGTSDVERMVGTARYAASLDSLEAALATEAFSGAVLVTDDISLAPDLPGVTIDLDSEPYHFGRRLAGVLRRQASDAVLYMGGGSSSLLGGVDLAEMARVACEGKLATNNAFSSDVAAFPVNDVVLAAIESVDRDNALARALAEGAGLLLEPLPRTLATQFDIDTPTDLAVLRLTGFGGPRLKKAIAAMDSDRGHYKRVLPLFVDTTKQIVVAGRVGSHAWSYLERETACRVRMFAEERGMEAEGRSADGSARSLLGFYLESVGIERFFKTLAELGDAAFIDTRVLLAHLRIDASREDRFLSDFGSWDEIRAPWLRDFARAALNAPIPVVLGGHSLVSGGLMALNEHAWSLRDERKL